MAGFEGYHGNEEDVYVKGKKQKPSVYKNTVHETLPDPETENEKPGVDFEDWQDELDSQDIKLKVLEDERAVEYEDTNPDSRIWDNETDSWVEQNEEIAQRKIRDELDKRLAQNYNSLEPSFGGAERLHDEFAQKHGRQVDYIDQPIKQDAPLPYDPKIESLQGHESMGAESERLRSKYGGPYRKIGLQSKWKHSSAKLWRKRGPLLGRDNLKTMPDEKKQRNFRQKIKDFFDIY